MLLLTFIFLESNSVVFLLFSFFLLLILVANSLGVFSCALLGIKVLCS